MEHDRLTEFVTVLVSALAVGSAATLAIMYLEGMARDVALVLIAGVTIAVWQHLRKRFRRR